MSGFSGFPADTLKFLRSLKRNNNREWFEKNKPRYENVFLDPALSFIGAMAKPVDGISDHFLAVPKKSGGSLMRIYRDTRFAKDKSPYKTNIGIQFRHEAGKDVHAPGFYVHIEPKSVFIGAGIWHPQPRVARQIREAIQENPSGWKRATGKAFQSKFELAGDSLKRPPAGVSPDDPLATDLMRKDFIGVANLEETDIESAAFATQAAGLFRTAKPLMRFLCEALELPF